MSNLLPRQSPDMLFCARGAKLPFSLPHQPFLTFLPFSYALNHKCYSKGFLVSRYLLGWETKPKLSQKREPHSPVKQIHNQPEHDPPFSSQSCKYFIIHVPSMLWQNSSSNDCREAINWETPIIKLLMYKSRRYSKCLHFPYFFYFS